MVHDGVDVEHYNRFKDSTSNLSDNILLVEHSGFTPPMHIMERRAQIIDGVESELYSHADPDDLLESHEYNLMLQHMQSNPECDIILIPEGLIDEHGNVLSDKPHYCCKFIVKTTIVKQVVAANRKKIHSDSHLLHLCRQQSANTKEWTNVAYWWRQHTNQMSKRQFQQDTKVRRAVASYPRDKK